MTRAQFIQSIIVADATVHSFAPSAVEQQLVIQRAAKYADELQQSGAAPWDSERPPSMVLQGGRR
jgi:hypothetical protein